MSSAIKYEHFYDTGKIQYFDRATYLHLQMFFTNQDMNKHQLQHQQLKSISSKSVCMVLHSLVNVIRGIY